MGIGSNIGKALLAQAPDMAPGAAVSMLRSILGFAIDGASVDEIATRAHLSTGTTRNYLSSAMAKLGASNRYEAALKARKFGWI